MFIFLAVTAAVAYSLQQTLLTTLFRTIGAFTTVSYRGLSLGITMAPLLLMVSATEFRAAAPVVPIILGASALTIVGNWAGAKVYGYLPVGLAAAVTISFFALVTLGIGLLTLDEHLTTVQLGAVFVMLSSVMLAGFTSPGSAETPFDIPRGVFYSVLFALFLGASFVIIGWASRQAHPFLVGYIWELGAGICGFMVLVAGRARPSLSNDTLWKILLYSSPTVIGTGCYAMAVTKGPVGLVATILTLEIPVCSVLAAALFHERLSKSQWALIFVMTLSVGILKALS